MRISKTSGGKNQEAIPLYIFIIPVLTFSQCGTEVIENNTGECSLNGPFLF